MGSVSTYVRAGLGGCDVEISDKRGALVEPKVLVCSRRAASQVSRCADDDRTGRRIPRVRCEVTADIGRFCAKRQCRWPTVGDAALICAVLVD